MTETTLPPADIEAIRKAVDWLKGEAIDRRWDADRNCTGDEQARKRDEAAHIDVIVNALSTQGAAGLPKQQCKCGQQEVPAGAHGVNWYWQNHARDKCVLELPNLRCWCGMLRSEHIDGHDPAAPHPDDQRTQHAGVTAERAVVDESGWLIEHGASEVSRPRYWGGVHGWTYDNLKAVRFARDIDAQSIAESMDDGVPDNYRIKEHGWS